MVISATLEVDVDVDGKVGCQSRVIYTGSWSLDDHIATITGPPRSYSCPTKSTSSEDRSCLVAHLVLLAKLLLSRSTALQSLLRGVASTLRLIHKDAIASLSERSAITLEIEVQPLQD